MTLVPIFDLPQGEEITQQEIQIHVPAQGIGSVSVAVEKEPVNGCRTFIQVGAFRYAHGKIVSEKEFWLETAKLSDDKGLSEFADLCRKFANEDS